MQVYSIPINSDQREITHHGTSEFPIAVYETDLEKNVLGYVPWHWHEEFEVIYIADGTLKLQTPGMERFLTREIWLRSMEMFFTLSSVIPWENCNPSCFPHF